MLSLGSSLGGGGFWWRPFSLAVSGFLWTGSLGAALPSVAAVSGDGSSLSLPAGFLWIGFLGVVLRSVPVNSGGVSSLTAGEFSLGVVLPLIFDSCCCASRLDGSCLW